MFKSIRGTLRICSSSEERSASSMIEAGGVQNATDYSSR